MAANQHIELGRNFREFADSNQTESEAFNSYAQSDWTVENGIPWSELLATAKVCVILGEPGSGKSHEFSSQVDELRAKGSCAIRVDLGQIVTNPNPALGQRDLESLRPWFDQKSSATIFLDAVDEAKLVRPTDFHAALKHISAWVGAKRNRTRFVISSRISAWRVGIDDIWVMEELLDNFSTHNENAKNVNVVRLLPLNSAQVELLLAPMGKDPKEFVTAMQDLDAIEFLGRPDDARTLYRIWLKKGHLGSVTEMMEEITFSKLRLETDRSDLTKFDLRDGANAICACLHLTRTLNIQLEDQLAATPTTSSVLLRNSLANDWSEAQRQSLIARPLFDAAAYGLVRVHHRTHQDYLAACWLRNLMQLECPYSELRQLIFAIGTNTALTIRPFMKGVATWLACIAPTDSLWSKALLEDLINYAPFVFLAYGDPHTLPITYRRRVLRSIVEIYRGRERVEYDIDTSTVKRFADAELTDDLAHWIADKSISTSIRADYIRIVKKCKLHGALPAIVNIAIDPLEPAYLRSPALDCVQNLGQQEDFWRLVVAIKALNSVSIELAGYFALAAYPHAINAAELFLMLRKLDQEPEQFSTGSLYWFEYTVLQKSPGHKREVSVFLSEVITFIAEEIDGRNTRRLWASKWLVGALAEVLKLSAINASDEILVIRSIELLESDAVDRSLHLDGIKNSAALNQLSLAHESIRRKYFWQEFTRVEAQRGRPPLHVYELSKHPHVLSIHASDIAWLAKDAQVSGGAQQAFAIGAILQLNASKHRPMLPFKFYLNAAAINPIAMKAIWGEVIRPLMYRWFQLRHLKSEIGRKYFWREKLLRIKRPCVHVINKIHFLCKIRKIRQGKWWAACYHVLECARQADVVAGNTSWANLSAAQVNHPYGARIGEAVLSGIDHLWRAFEPPLTHENKAIFAQTLHGQFALNFAFVAQGAPFFQKLTTKEAATATRYALRSLNGLPNWFAAICGAHSAVVHDTVEKAIQGDWHCNDPDAQYSSTLGSLVSAFPNIAAAVVPLIKQLLHTAPTQKAGLLDQALSAVIAGDVSAVTWLPALAQQNLKHGKHEDVVGRVWLKHLFQIDANLAFELAEKITRGLDSAVASEFVSALCAALANHHHQQLLIQVPDFRQPKFLSDFIPWIFRYLSLATDPQHSGAHQVLPRDEAVIFRTSLVRLLAFNPAPEAAAALQQILLAPEVASSRDWLLQVIDQQAQASADDFRLQPDDVFELFKRHERMPRSRADLFELAQRRILTFKENVELNENSLRHEVHLADWVEHDYQFWIKKYLDEKSLGRYTVTAESEVDPGKFPDLRIENANVSGAVFVEIKVANKWTYNELIQALESQLVGQYLRAESAQHGIFLLFHNGVDKNNWNPDASPKLDWLDLLKNLKDKARLILTARCDIERIAVIGIDVRKPKLN